MKLTLKEKKFVDLYDGEHKSTALKAGYSPKYAKEIGYQKYTKLHQEIQKRQDKAIIKANAPHIASRQERQGFWAEVMLSDKVSMTDRLRASELLGKSEADFTDKLQHTGAYNVTPSEEMKKLFDDFKTRQKKAIDVDKCT